MFKQRYATNSSEVSGAVKIDTSNLSVLTSNTSNAVMIQENDTFAPATAEIPVPAHFFPSKHATKFPLQHVWQRMTLTKLFAEYLLCG